MYSDAILHHQWIYMDPIAEDNVISDVQLKKLIKDIIIKKLIVPLLHGRIA